METLSLTSLHVVSDIHAFSLASCARGFGTALSRAAKIPSSLFRAVGGWRGSRLRPPEVPGVILQGGAEEATQNHIMVLVMPGVPDGHIKKKRRHWRDCE